MSSRVFYSGVRAVLFLLAPLLFIACGDGDGRLSRPEVEEIVREELADVPAPVQREPGLTSADVEEAIRAAMADMPQPVSGLSQEERSSGLSKPPSPRSPRRRTHFADVDSPSATGRCHGPTMPQPVSGLSQEEVERIVEAAIASTLASQPGLTSADVEDAIGAALAVMPQPEPGLTSAEAERIARGVVASIPPKSAPAEYTGFFVENAISRYQTQGLDTTLAYYNREESIDGQWYVFVIDENDLVIGHPDAHRLGLDLKGWVGTDANGYNFGPDMLSATEDGKWVSYVYRNPENGGIGADHTGALEYKHVWVVRHDGLLFASGWHISADEYTQFVVDEAIARYHAEGLDSTLAYYNSPDSVDAQWYVFVATPEGEILGHYNADDLGVHLEEMLEDGSFQATEEGIWVTHEDVNPVTGEVEDKHFWLVEHDGLVFGSGWHHDESGS